MREKGASEDSGRGSRRKVALRIFVLVLFGVVLFVVASAVTLAHYLDPEHLTAIVEEIADHELDADVTVGRVNLSVRNTYPFVDIDIDSVVVVSRKIRALPPEVRDTLPQWADTLAKVQRVHGAVNILDAMQGKIDLGALDIAATEVNVLYINDEVNNFDILRKGRAGSDTVPAIRVNVDIPRGRVYCGGYRLDDVSLSMEIVTSGRLLDDTRIIINSMRARRDATDIAVSGMVLTPVSDPQFDVDIRGKFDISHLPPGLLAAMPGTFTGVVKADAHIRGSRSMLTPDALYRLRVKGDIDAEHIYYIAADTLSMFYSRHITARLGHAVGDSVTAVVEIDSAAILKSGYDIGIDSLRLSTHTLMPKVTSDTAWVYPTAGSFDVGRLSVRSMHDGAGAVFSLIGGRVALKPYGGDASLPEVDFDAGIATITCGGRRPDATGRNCHLTFSAGKMHHLARRADSSAIVAAHPQIPAAQAYAAVKSAWDRRPHHPHRVRLAFDAQGREYIHWGTSRLVRELFNDWKIGGMIAVDTVNINARAMKIANSIGNLNVKFDNEHAVLAGVRYHIGGNDLTLSGTIGNMRRAFTSPGFTSPLKADFTVKSRHVDIGRILGVALADADSTSVGGAASAKGARKWLLPVNISAQVRFAADEVAYSDIALTDLGFTAGISDGSLDIRGLKAYSDAGAVDVSARYTAPAPGNRDIEFDLKVNRFMIADFLTMVPAVDSIMPVIHSLKGVIDADVSARALIDNDMDILMPTLKATVHITGDSLQMHDPAKMNVLAKWLLAGKHDINTVNHLSVTAEIADNRLTVQPFDFDLNRYRLRIYGHNDIVMNFDYHIKVLRTPLRIPIHFTLDISGNPKKWKIK